MIERIKKGKFVLGSMLLLVLAIVIPVTLGQVQKNQETRSRASGETVSVILNPQTSNLSVGENVNITVAINGGQNNISAVDITFTYNTALLQQADGVPIVPMFTPSSTFSQILLDANTPGTIRFVGVNPTSGTITGSAIALGTLNFKAKSAGTATVGFSNIRINASGVANALPVDTQNTIQGSYTISGSQSNVSPTPTLSASPTSSAGQSTTINLNLQLVGIGANSASGLNNSPQTPVRNVEISVFDGQNTKITQGTFNASYNSSDGLYKGSFTTNVTSGPYIVKVRMDNTMWKQIPGIQNVAAGGTNTLTATTLVTGDVNGDNEINLIDYNLMTACLGSNEICQD